MSHDHQDVAWQIRFNNPAHHHVLLAMCDAACKFCGLTWVGVPSLALKTGWGTTVVRGAIKKLGTDGYLALHAYPRGGRSRATEYIVLPGIMELSTAPCAICSKNQQKASRGGGYDKNRTDKATATRGLLHKATGIEHLNPTLAQAISKARKASRDNAMGADFGAKNVEHPVIEPIPSQKKMDPQPSASGAVAPPLFDPTLPPPQNAEDALARIKAMVDGVAPSYPSQRPNWGKDGSQTKPSEGHTAPRMPESGTEAVKQED